VIRFPSPPIVSATLSGFVIGVLVTLMATGVINRSPADTGAPPRATTPVPVKSVRDQLLETQLSHLATRMLGADPAGSNTRLRSVRLVPVSDLDRELVSPGPRRSYHSIMLTFKLNDHPLGPTWRLREARADIFALLKAIYVSSLPVYNTELIGRFNTGHQKPYDAVVAYMTYQTAAKIPWKRWGRTHEAQVWSMLDYHVVDHRFE
jgi:hypothetical protein